MNETFTTVQFHFSDTFELQSYYFWIIILTIIDEISEGPSVRVSLLQNIRLHIKHT